jgi:AraC-like DNA-binding protein
MKYWYQKPHLELSEYIRTVLILEAFSPFEPGKPLVTSGMPALICKTEKDQTGIERIKQLMLFGKSTPPDCWVINENTTVIAYFFNPFAMASMFGISATQLATVPIELNQWSPHKTNALRTQLTYAGNTKQKIGALDSLLIHQLDQNNKECEMVRQATDQIMYNPEAEVLSAVLEKLGLNQRTFQRTFKKYVGVTPSQYRRICQFQLSFAQVRSKEFEKLGDVAFDNGFADQSHFIRSFREFTQVTPNTYLKLGLKEKK